MKQRDIGRDKRGEEVSKLLKRRLNDASNVCTNSNYPTKFWFHWDFCWTMWSSFVFLLRSKEHSFVDRINLAPQLFDWLLAWTCIYLSKVGARVWSALYQFLQILKLIKIVYAFQVSKINCLPLLRNTESCISVGLMSVVLVQKSLISHNSRNGHDFFLRSLFALRCRLSRAKECGE